MSEHKIFLSYLINKHMFDECLFFLFFFLQKLLMLQCCIGIIGGKPKHSLFFVGFQGMLGDITAVCDLSDRFKKDKNLFYFPSIPALIKMTIYST